jgi:short-subunit dehydrogenase
MQSVGIQRILIVGGTSNIGFEVAKHFAGDGARIVLAGRKRDLIDQNCRILNKLGAAQAEAMHLDVLEFDRHPAIANEVSCAIGGLDAVLFAHGVAHPQFEIEKYPALARNEIEINLSSTVSLLMYMANFFQKQCQGVVAVISSVAGDKGRREQHIYASTKAGLSTFMQGYRHRLAPFGVRVLTIKPGLTKTQLTENIRTPFRKLLFSSASTVGFIIYKAMRYGNGVVYAPWYWRWIILAVKLIPESIFLLFKYGLLGVESKQNSKSEKN